MSTDGPDVTTPGLLRAVRAEARHDERVRLLDQLRTAHIQAEREAAARRSNKPANTAEGRRAAGLAAAIELLEDRAAAVEPGEPYAYINGPCDSVELYVYDEPDSDGVEEAAPVRIVTLDGADDTTAAAYLPLDDAEQLFREGLDLVARIRQRHAQRQAAAEAMGAEDDEVARMVLREDDDG